VRTDQDVTVRMHRNARRDMTVSVVYSAHEAPVAEGEPIARLVVEAPGYEPRSFPLVAAYDVERKGLFARAGEALVRMIRAPDGDG
jgi:D-alanyl-D-alanine carboxypeptidase (penicillin-binding protein 5/6)